METGSDLAVWDEHRTQHTIHVPFGAMLCFDGTVIHAGAETNSSTEQYRFHVYGDVETKRDERVLYGVKR